MKLISWNVNGIRACVQKGFLDFFREADADIFCIQETKMQEGQLTLELEGYHQYWNYAVRKGYSGTAVFTKKEPISVTYGIGIEEHDQEGRVITCEFENFYFVTVYTPNSQNELARLDYRMKWEDDFRAYLKKLVEQRYSTDGGQTADAAELAKIDAMDISSMLDGDNARLYYEWRIELWGEGRSLNVFKRFNPVTKNRGDNHFSYSQGTRTAEAVVFQIPSAELYYNLNLRDYYNL